MQRVDKKEYKLKLTNKKQIKLINEPIDRCIVRQTPTPCMQSKSQTIN